MKVLALKLSLVILLTLVHSSVAQAQTDFEQEVPNTEEATTSAYPSPAPQAVQPVNLTVSPISINLVTDPGRAASTPIKIRNNSDKAEYLRLRLNTFIANSSGNAPLIREFDPSDPSQKWLSFSETQFRIDPGEWKTVQLNFNPPETAALGYYYAVLVERQSEADREEGSSLIAGVPAILVLTEVSSPLARKQLELVSFTVTKSVYEYLPTQFEVVIRNSGNIQTMPIGDIFIDGQHKNDIGIMQLNPAKGVILPGTERTFYVNWEDGFPSYSISKDEFGKEKKGLNWDFSNVQNFRIGKFTATTLFVYDDGERDIPTEASVSFWVLPWKLMALFIVLVALILTGIILPIIIITKKLRKRSSENTH